MDKRGKTSYPGNLVWQPQTIKGVAAMATFREFTYPSSDGIHICWAGQWLPDEGQPRAVVQIVHGVAEHMGRYDAFARFLAGHGFAVCG